MQERYILEMRNISKTFPGVQALKEVDFLVKLGEVHCLAGANGAGKSTLIKILSGALQPDKGEIFVNGQKVNFRNPIDAQAMGIATIYQELSLIPQLTAAENIFVNNYPSKGTWINWKAMLKLARGILAEIGVENLDIEKPVEKLSVGQQQLIELARVLMRQARIIIMDEPSATLSAEEFNLLAKVIKDLKKKGVTIIYISHKLEELFELGDRVTVLRDGKLIGTYEVNRLDYDSLVELIVGHHPTKERNELHSLGGAGETVVSLRGVSTSKLRDINLRVKAGEIVGLYGLVGSGRTELLRVIFGIDKIKTGKIEVFGRAINPKYYAPDVACSLGIGLVPEDRKRQGIIPNLTVTENLIISSLPRLSRCGLLRYKIVQSLTSTYIRNLKVKTPSSYALISKLSGGNQQKVVIGRWLISGVKLLLFDEPTQGIDVGAKEEIYNLIRELAVEGKTIIIASSEIDELVRLCNRIYVLYGGEIVTEVNPQTVPKEKILHSAITGGKGFSNGRAHTNYH
ncbi:MAG: sugar ABC transporter ATP-binding protein [Moorellaceae bacterium]